MSDEQEISERRKTNIFPPKDGAALDAVDVSDSMVASGHRSVVWFSLYYINAAKSERDDRRQAARSLTPRRTSMLCHVVR
jgi:hypothetical protein